MRSKKKSLRTVVSLTLALALLGSLCLPVFAADEALPEEQEMTETLEATVNAAEGTDAEVVEDEEPVKDEEAAEDEEPAEDEAPAEESTAVNAQNGASGSVQGEQIPTTNADGYVASSYDYNGAYEAIRLGKTGSSYGWVSRKCYYMKDGTILIDFIGLYRGDLLSDGTYQVARMTVIDVLLNGKSVPFTTEGEYTTIDKETVDNAFAASGSDTLLLEFRFLQGQTMNSIQGTVDYRYPTEPEEPVVPEKPEEPEVPEVPEEPEEPAIVVSCDLSTGEAETEDGYTVAYVDDGLTVDYTVEGDLAPVSVYLNGVSVPFTVEATEGAVAAATTAGDGTSGGGTAGSATQGGKIVLSSQTLSAYGKVGEVNTLDVAFSVGGSTEEPAQTVQMQFVLKNKVVASAPADKTEQTETKTETKPTTETKTDSQASTITAPDTGDHTNQALWLSLIAFSAVGLASVSVYRKKKDVRFFR